MASKKIGDAAKKSVFIVLSFLLAVILFALSYCIAIEVTVFNSEYILNNMNSSSYFADKKDEITDDLIDLGNASGLNEEFFNDLLDEVMLHEDTEEYLSDFYSGEGSVIDTTSFKQEFNAALDQYIEDNDIDPDSVDSESREYLIKEAASIYSDSLTLPFFSTIAGTFLAIRKIMPYVLAVLIILLVLFCLIFVFSQKWKHRSVRYIYYSTASAFLASVALPAALLISGKLSQINLTSRATYNLFVACGNGFLYSVLFIALFYLVVSVGLYFSYRALYKKAIS